MNMKQYETFELRFGGEVLPDAWAQIDLTATFSCAQESLTVKGFYDGESDGRGVYVVRFLPQYAGVYRYQVRGASRRRAKLSAKRPPRRRTESSAPSARTLPLRTRALYSLRHNRLCAYLAGRRAGGANAAIPCRRALQ